MSRTHTHPVMLIVLAVLALVVAAGVAPRAQSKAELALKAAMDKEVVDGDLKGAIELYRKIAQGSDRAVAARALVRIGQCYEKLGDTEMIEARKAYEQVVREFGDQAEIAAQARARLAVLGRPRGATGLVARQVLADASGVSGVLSADGRYLRGIDGATGDVIQFDVATGQLSRVTNKGGPEAREQPDYRAVLSRDGTRIAYGFFTKDGDFRLRIRNLDGTGLRTLGSEKNPYIVPLDWSPDGTSILAFYDNGPGHVELSLISTADGSARVLRSIPGSIMYHTAGVSPDGRSAAFSFVRDGNPPQADVFVMTADGRNEVVVAGHPAEDRLLQWTPDGGGLVFLSDRSGTWDLWTVRIAGGKQQGEPQVLKRDFGMDADVLGISPDGSLYYRTSTPLGRLYYGAIDLETGKGSSCRPRRSRRGTRAPWPCPRGHPTAGTWPTFRVRDASAPETTSSRSGPPRPAKNACCPRVFATWTCFPGRQTAVRSSRAGVRRQKLYPSESTLKQASTRGCRG